MTIVIHVRVHAFDNYFLIINFHLLHYLNCLFCFQPDKEISELIEEYEKGITSLKPLANHRSLYPIH